MKCISCMDFYPEFDLSSLVATSFCVCVQVEQHGFDPVNQRQRQKEKEERKGKERQTCPGRDYENNVVLTKITDS